MESTAWNARPLSTLQAGPPCLTSDSQKGGIKISGTLRIVVGNRGESHSDVPPIDAMSFMEPSGGWPEQNKGWADSEIAEVGRFRTPSMRRDGVDIWLTHQLYEAGVEFVRSRQVRIVYVIFPRYLKRLIPGIQIQEIDSKLKVDDPSAARVFEQFSLYWQRSQPKLYHLPDAPTPWHLTEGLAANHQSKTGVA